ncbi:alpha/beta-Hydrolase [Glarea lozoyensis ATCC 20868]|uniref:Alpha/beta-Hydrolase n=1 Tax=Glarea lozoyensis (strain ATCC 20868 / MF5171) TaxID=1116229 RepID=S3D0C9_GLAL2|nr:alpha/beta-Hydrolase [Glarea lozoyensis ATCC 20868]EPE31280.1 alpha/beta-Hydrolase [Glarea lozoyensis ATCC 20868]
MAPALPRIAFFHGGGSNSTISEIQCSPTAHALRNEYEFVFFDAPFERSAGPEVLPAFRDEIYQPYRSWFTSPNGIELTDGSGFESSGMMEEDGIDRVWDMMRQKGGNWVAAMGFSQGTRVVGGLLLDQQRRKEAGLFRNGDIDLQFGVLCMGGGAPMVSSISRDGSNKLDLIKVPTLHLHGTIDPNYQRGKEQFKTYYDPQHSAAIEIEYRHAMPWKKSDVEKFVQCIRKIAGFVPVQEKRGW